MTVALKKGWTSTARERYSSFVFDFEVLSHFFRIFEKAVPLISTNCWSLFRSVANCWKPSSRVVNLDDRLEMPWRDLMTFFLSSKVLSRILSYVTVGDDKISNMGPRELMDWTRNLILPTYLGFFLQIESVHLVQFSFLLGCQQVQRNIHLDGCMQ